MRPSRLQEILRRELVLRDQSRSGEPYGGRLGQEATMIGLLCISFMTPALAGDVAAGRTLWKANCMACHGQNADGKGPAAALLSSSLSRSRYAAAWHRRSG